MLTILENGKTVSKQFLLTAAPFLLLLATAFAAHVFQPSTPGPAAASPFFHLSLAILVAGLACALSTAAATSLRRKVPALYYVAQYFLAVAFVVFVIAALLGHRETEWLGSQLAILCAFAYLWLLDIIQHLFKGQPLD